MDAQFYWKLFEETGAPELYVLYQKSLSEGDGHSAAGPSPVSC